MVQFNYFVVFVLLLRQSTNSEMSSEESEQIFLKSKKSYYSPSNQFHCDLSLLPQQKKMMYHGLQLKRSERSFDIYKWPKNKDGFVIVPYKISRNSHYTSDQVRLIRFAMDAIEAVTCIQFRARSYEEDYVAIHSGPHCKSNLGRTGGAQELSLNNKLCVQKGIIIHELLHALGYIHEHNRPDRDKHVKVLWQNIDQRYLREFNKVDGAMYNYYGTSYDYQSIMHYGPTAFTKNGARTIVPKDSSYSNMIGQRSGLSDGDIKRINTKYKCFAGSSNFLSSFENIRVRGKPSLRPNYDEHFDDDDDDSELEDLYFKIRTIKA